MKININIEELLPHRDPFLFVDKIISASKDDVVAVKTFDKGNKYLQQAFPNHLYVPGSILIESMVQSGGAAVRFIGIAQGTFALASIDFVNFLHPIDFNKSVTYNIKHLKITDKIIRQSGKAFVNDQLVMEASWMSVKMDR